MLKTNGIRIVKQRVYTRPQRKNDFLGMVGNEPNVVYLLLALCSMKVYFKNGYDEEARIREFYQAGEDKVVFRKMLHLLTE